LVRQLPYLRSIVMITKVLQIGSLAIVHGYSLRTRGQQRQQQQQRLALEPVDENHWDKRGKEGEYSLPKSLKGGDGSVPGFNLVTGFLQNGDSGEGSIYQPRWYKKLLYFQDLGLTYILTQKKGCNFLQSHNLAHQRHLSRCVHNISSVY
jgi:hypothetical protein